MENITKTFQIKKFELLNLYDELVKYKFIPFEDNGILYDEMFITGIKKSLESEEFTISVSGAIKCGKSTLLNHLIFDDEGILPVSVTPETAVLTKIKYGKERKALINFYSEEDWNKLKNNEITDKNGISINYFNKFLRDHVNNSAKKGIYDKEVVRDKSYCKVINDFSLLNLYISAEGVYTPFVSSVELEIPSEFLKDVVIVDTPGLDDPNELRSKITKDWISKSNAVIYLMYAAKALTNQDWNFIDNQLAFVESSKIIFAISKIDIPQDPEIVRTFVERNIINSKKFKDRNLQQEKVLKISVKAAVVNKKIKNNIKLSQTEENIKLNNYELINNVGFIKDFIDQMDKQLMRDKGESIIKSNKVKIEEVCIKKIKKLEEEFLNTEELKKSFDLSVEEIDDKLSDIKNIREKIDMLRNDTEKEIKNRSKSIKNEFLKKIINEIIEPTKLNYKEWLFDKGTSPDDAINLTGFNIKKLLTNNLLRFNEDDILGSLFLEKLNEIKSELINEIKTITKNIFTSRANKFYNPSIDLSNIINGIVETVKKDLKSNVLGEMRERVWGFLWTKKEKTKGNILNIVDEVLDDLRVELIKDIEVRINNEIIEYFRDIIKDVEKLLSGYNDQYIVVKDQQNNKSNQLKIAKDKLSLIESEIVKFSNYKEEIISKLNKN